MPGSTQSPDFQLERHSLIVVFHGRTSIHLRDLPKLAMDNPEHDMPQEEGWSPYRPTDPFVGATTRSSPLPLRNGQSDILEETSKFVDLEEGDHDASNPRGGSRLLGDENYSNLEVADPVANAAALPLAHPDPHQITSLDTHFDIEGDDPYNPRDPFADPLDIGVPQSRPDGYLGLFRPNVSSASFTPALIPQTGPPIGLHSGMDAEYTPYRPAMPHSRSDPQPPRPAPLQPSSLPPPPPTSVPRQSMTGRDRDPPVFGGSTTSCRPTDRQALNQTPPGRLTASWSPLPMESPVSFDSQRDSSLGENLGGNSAIGSFATPNTTVDGVESPKIVVGLDFGTTFTGSFTCFTPPPPPGGGKPFSCYVCEWLTIFRPGLDVDGRSE